MNVLTGMRLIAMSGLVSSVGVDLDSHDGYTLLRSFYNSLRFGNTIVFYTNHGFHLIVKLFNPVSYYGALIIRGLLGDDPDRLAVDEYRVNVSGDVRRFDTLFVGRLKNGESYTRHEIQVL